MTDELNIRRVVSVRHSESDRWHRRAAAPRGYDALVLMTKGAIDYCFEGMTLSARAGDLFLLPGDLPYSGQQMSERVAFYVIDFLSDTPQAAQNFGAPCFLSRDVNPDTRGQFSAILSLWERQPLGIELHLRAFLYGMMCKKFKVETETRSTHSANAVMEYIVAHLGEHDLNVKRLCRLFYISESQLRRNLVAATGLRPNDYILRLRLDRAKNDLLDTERSIKEIAAEYGFSNQYYFSQCFTKAYGLSPRAFRSAYRS